MVYKQTQKDGDYKHTVCSPPIRKDGKPNLKDTTHTNYIQGDKSVSQNGLNHGGHKQGDPVENLNIVIKKQNQASDHRTRGRTYAEAVMNGNKNLKNVRDKNATVKLEKGK